MKAHPTAMDSSNSEQQFERSLHGFIVTEIELGTTFAHVALDSWLPEKRERNLRNAQKAYDTAVGFLNRHRLTNPAVRKEEAIGLAGLKQLLFRLRGTFPG